MRVKMQGCIKLKIAGTSGNGINGVNQTISDIFKNGTKMINFRDLVNPCFFGARKDLR